MAKLYWRIKRNGKWTWEAATPDNTKYEGDGLPYYTGPEKYVSAYPEDIVDKPEVYSDEL